MRKNIHRQFLGFLCAVMCACSLAVPCFAADAAAPDPGISFYMENINDAQCVLTVQNGKASASASVTGRRGAERCKIVLEIQKKQGNQWITVDSWSVEKDGRNANLSNLPGKGKNDRVARREVRNENPYHERKDGMSRIPAY